MAEDDWVRDLDEYVMGESGLSDDQQIEPPPDQERAEMLLRARSKLQRDRGQIDSVYQSQRVLLDAWHQDRTAGLDARIVQIETVLEQYMRAVNLLEPKRKSLSLPHGTLQLRAQGRALVRVVDPEAFMAWATARDDTERFVHEPEPKPAGLKELADLLEQAAEGDEFEQDGKTFKRWNARVDDDIVPGVEIVRQVTDNFGIK